MFFKNLRMFLSGAGWRQDGVQSGLPSSRVSDTAVPVTLDTALQVSAVWACVKLIAESVSSLPITIYEIDNDGVRKPSYNHPLMRLFAGKVNRWQTKQEYFETLVYQFCLMGNDYTYVEFNNRGEPVSLVPLMSQQMQVQLEAGERIYLYQESSNVNAYSEKSIWHNKLFGNGVVGLSPLEYAKGSIGIGSATEKLVSGIYKNGGRRSGVISIDKMLTEEQRTMIKTQFADLADGTEDRLRVLEAGMQFKELSMSPQDIELLASRRFQIEDIARFFGVPSVLINDTQAGTTWGSGLEQIVQGFYKFNLRPYLERYEASMKCFFFKPEERHKYDIEFDFTRLIQPAFGDRIKIGKEAVQGGLMTANEWRKGEGMTPKDGGDNLMVQRQMISLSKIDDPDFKRGITNNG